MIELNARVVKYSEKSASVELANNSIIMADLVIAADGIKSKARATIYKDTIHEPSFNGFAAYRATVDVQKIKADPEIAWIIEEPSLNIWYV
ncbi:unnamed protein product [Alternaria alternata]